MVHKGAQVREQERKEAFEKVKKMTSAARAKPVDRLERVADDDLVKEFGVVLNKEFIWRQKGTTTATQKTEMPTKTTAC